MLLITFYVAQAAAEAQAQARKGMLRGQPSDKRKLNQKGIQRIDSMQFGGVRLSCPLPRNCTYDGNSPACRAAIWGKRSVRYLS